MPKELVVAPAVVIDEILQNAVRPLLIHFEQSLKTSLTLKVAHGIDANVTYSVIAGQGENYQNGFFVGDAKLRIWLNQCGNRYLFRIDAVFANKVSPKTGFSGFGTSGAVTVIDEGLRLDQHGYTVRYNVWKLPDWTQRG